MSYSLDESYLKLAEVDPQFEILYRSMVEEWDPEIPPPTILFGTYGQVFSQKIYNGSKPELTRILNLIEDLLQYGDEQVKDAVATGFWDAVLSESSNRKLDFRILVPYIGIRSKNYCLAWDAFCGIKTPGLE
jgi:hypothetical protein